MTERPTMLHLGSGKRNLTGFLNIDLDPAADLQHDLRRPLPFEDAAFEGIFSEHFIEHLTAADAGRFLRECLRVLKPGGRLRLATPDLDAVIAAYQGNWRDQPWIKQFGIGGLTNRACMLNLSLREWGHQWVYNEEELRRQLLSAGFCGVRRFDVGVSAEPLFRTAEYRTDSLVLEARSPLPTKRPSDLPPALVSVLLPAYHTAFFPIAFRSALEQTYKNLEVIVSDDSPNDDTERLVTACGDPRVSYVRNTPALGSRNNYLACFARAQGEYIKFLNDDDYLAPNCVERMVAVLDQCPQVALVTSYRQQVDAEGKPLPDRPFTAPLTRGDMIIDGTAIMDVLMRRLTNFIGEPTTTLFRRTQADAEPDFMSLGGTAVHWNVDVAIWAHLLQVGALAYLREPLSFFRRHPGQEQHQSGVDVLNRTAWTQIRELWAGLGRPIQARDGASCIPLPKVAG